LAFYENINLNNYYCAPNKFWDYINNGLAVITYKFPGLMDVIEKNQIGVCVEEITAMTVKDAIEKINTNNYYRNLENLQGQFIWENQEENFLSIFAN
jgi:hypothetical protein